MDHKQPRFILLEEQSDAAETLLSEPFRPARKFRRIILYSLLMIAAAFSLYYLSLFLKKESPEILFKDSLPLNGRIKEKELADLNSPENITPPIKIAKSSFWEELFNFFNKDSSLSEKKEMEKNPQKTEGILPIEKIKISEHNGLRNRQWIHIKGKVINKTYGDQSFIKVNVDYLDKDENIVASDFTYAAGEPPLKRGEEKDFNIMSRNQEKIDSYELYLENY